MKIIFTKHTINKFLIFSQRGIGLTKAQIEKVIRSPEHIDIESDFPKTIASGKLDRKRILRVVYKKEDDIIKIITFYPAEKGRYY